MQSLPNDNPEQQDLIGLPVEPYRGYLLLVEDHDVNQILIRSMAERLGYRTELAVDGADAVAKIDDAGLRGAQYDLVLMDVQMPVMDGCEAARMIRAIGVDEKTLPIVAITANAEPEDIDRCLAAGMQDHISKPILMDELERVLSDRLEMADPTESGSMDVEKAPHFSDHLTDRYALRRAQALSSISSLVRVGTFLDQDLQEISDHMHKLAGTAGMFGEPELGLQAKDLEDGIARWQIAERPSKIKTCVESILDCAHG
ncbi:response regulator [Parasphingorhabdus sp.]|uniref:response regulator n=1 Tax=Parasphingorhabdus sp. TaxID=2709688 RepID=UPI003263F275